MTTQKTTEAVQDEKRGRGRPSLYTEELAEQICEAISEGMSLREIVKLPGMPDRVTVYRWLAGNREFCNQYARAREEQADLLADEIIQIADTPMIGERVTVGKDGVTTVQEDMTAHRRLQIDVRKWKASKLAPKKYGDSLKTEHSGQIAVEKVKTGISAMVSLNLDRMAALELLNSQRPAKEQV